MTHTDVTHLGGTGIVHINLNVTLTGTTNQYLAPRLPLDGLLEITETSRFGDIVTAVFRERRADGTLTGPAHVEKPTFEYR
ncbi:hypothetical protein GS896_25520 [Rhodococcus hoagii]|nr:hypothetical protein [Prescottella equi]MBM4654134.1 hypothetical protein [Prescottella equi]MBM4719608.1 hypothetical protein [Prescottella equi]NKR23406.1 hypothetical protein [Prescottella equi]NKT55982.1 hypothetical protein [Prescottella equi]